MLGAGDIRELRAGVRAAGLDLRSRTVEARAQAIERACQLLLAAQSAHGHALRAELTSSTGLSPPGIEHGLRTTLGAFRQDALLALHAGRPHMARAESRATELATVVLAGNVFSAAARPLLLPLLCGVPVLLKAASNDDVLPRALQRALAHVDAALGAACAVVTFARDDAELRAALIEDAELLSVYGDDDTMAAFRAIAPAATQLVAHGHGLGVAFVAASELVSTARARAAADALARDVAAYDQRGCLSPQRVFVQRGAACDPRGFALLLADALEALAPSWPRATLPADSAAAQLQWRGVAAASGELHVRASCAVSFARGLRLRASPGYRNVSVQEIADLPALRARLTGLSVQLKVLGVAGTAELAALTGAAPYVCALGAMQEPPLHAHLDGLHPLAGL